MLNLIFQKAKAEDPGKVYVDSRWLFSQKKEDAWFQESFVKQVIDFVDKASVVDGCVLRSKEGKIIPPEYLSTGCKTAICVYEFPEYIFNATQMGDNALLPVIKLSEIRDITLLTYRNMPYDWLEKVGFLKDYKPVDLDGYDDIWELHEEWMEEIMND